jgi:hypothetical protein
MHVDVIGDAAITEQTRAYAEYRMFATLARFSRAIRDVRVTIKKARSRGSVRNIACEVTVTLDPSGSAHARVSGPEACVIIDRAAERIGPRVYEQTGRRLSL